MTTTNSCEAWHRKLKGGSGLRKGDTVKHGMYQYSYQLSEKVTVLNSTSIVGIYGMVFNITEIGHNVDNRAKKAECDFRGSKLSVYTKEYPEIGGFPVPLQKLLTVKLGTVEERILIGKFTPMFEQYLKCNCHFTRQYFLPCNHIFHLDVEDKVLTPPVWKSYVNLFEEGGFEVYETMGWVDVEE